MLIWEHPESDNPKQKTIVVKSRIRDHQSDEPLAIVGYGAKVLAPCLRIPDGESILRSVETSRCRQVALAFEGHHMRREGYRARAVAGRAPAGRLPPGRAAFGLTPALRAPAGRALDERVAPPFAPLPL